MWIKGGELNGAKNVTLIISKVVTVNLKILLVAAIEISIGRLRLARSIAGNYLGNNISIDG